MAMLCKVSSSLFLSLSLKPKLIYRTNAFLLSRSTATTSKHKTQNAKAGLAKEKRRTRSDKHFNPDAIIQHCNVNHSDTDTKFSHIPVMLGEVMDVFSAASLTSFVDCTLGAAGHSTAVIKGHPEMKFFVGMDVDSVAHDIAQPRLDAVLSGDVKAFTVLRNFRDVKSVLREFSDLHMGVDGILMDLGMSSMQVDNPARGFSVLSDGPLDMRMDPQASLKAEDILNSWPDSEVGRILREYGEESNWRTLQKKIVNARLHGGFHSTSDLLDLIKRVTPPMKGGRQGWIKTATRVFQALRIAVNDELKTLEDSLYSCFDCLAPKGRLAVISFHSLEDRIVKQTFLNIVKGSLDVEERENLNSDLRKTSDEIKEKEAWIKQVIHGSNGTILTKRPITPSGEEEKLNRRSRSAKLRVIQKH
ncbi:ribosomal RNA small subunit methyltransferase H-like [Vigna umbellata]|uniref:ribosomal RNA small subunit methyltransferase H-like n=1 Tax=Vigna umbellata TaxID=87088 RepID=UPI001F5E5EAB|nr:ribosomal RNA small subunit methyltransferase H-like [Vigna umbellata]